MKVHFLLNPEISIGEYLLFGKVGDKIKSGKDSSILYTVYYIDDCCILIGNDIGSRVVRENKDYPIVLLDYRFEINRKVLC